MVEELQNVVHFLGYHMSPEILECVSRQREGLYHRRRSRGEGYLDDVYTPEMKKKIYRIRAGIYERLGLRGLLSISKEII